MYSSDEIGYIESELEYLESIGIDLQQGRNNRYNLPILGEIEGCSHGDMSPNGSECYGCGLELG